VIIHTIPIPNAKMGKLFAEYSDVNNKYLYSDFCIRNKNKYIFVVPIFFELYEFFLNWISIDCTEAEYEFSELEIFN